MITLRDQLVMCAREWLGVPFRPRGRTRAGVDCVGFLFAVAKTALGWPSILPSFRLHLRSHEAFRAIREYTDRIAPDEAGPGDIIQMNYGGESTHFGMLTEHGVIHCVLPAGKVTEQAISERACGCVVAYYRLKGVPPWRESP